MQEQTAIYRHVKTETLERWLETMRLLTDDPACALVLAEIERELATRENADVSPP